MALFDFNSCRYEMLMSVYSILVYATQRAANCIALAILIGTYQLVNDIRARRGTVMPASVFAAMHSKAPGESSISGTACSTVLVGSWVQLQATVSAGTGSRGVSCPPAYIERLFSLCGDLTARKRTVLRCPCVGGYFWNWTVTFCIELNVLWTDV